MQVHPHVIPARNVLAYITAGKATFTARGREHRFTFRVKQPRFEGVPAADLRYVSVLTGPDNTHSYTFFGCLVRKHGRWEFRPSNKAKIGQDALSVVAFKWIVRRLAAGMDLTQDVEIWHDGRCGKCGHPLTVPESIETGLGPICAQNL